MFCAGVYGRIPHMIDGGTHGPWRANQSARAKIPSTVTSIGVILPRANVTSHYALDAKGGMFLSQHNFSSCLIVTRRTFAHRVLRNIMVRHAKS